MAARTPRDELLAKPMAEIRNILRGHAKLNGSKASLVDEILRLGLYPLSSHLYRCFNTDTNAELQARSKASF